MEIEGKFFRFQNICSRFYLFGFQLCNYVIIVDHVNLKSYE